MSCEEFARSKVVEEHDIFLHVIAFSFSLEHILIWPYSTIYAEHGAKCRMEGVPQV